MRRYLSSIFYYTIIIFYFVSCAFVASRKLQTLRVYLLFCTIQMIYSIFVSCTIICQCMLKQAEKLQMLRQLSFILYYTMIYFIFVSCTCKFFIFYFLGSAITGLQFIFVLCKDISYFCILYHLQLFIFYFLGSAYHWPLVYFEPCNFIFIFVLCTPILL